MRCGGIPVLPKELKIRKGRGTRGISDRTDPQVADRMMKFYDKLTSVYYKACQDRAERCREMGMEDEADDIEFLRLYSQWIHYSTQYLLGRSHAMKATHSWYAPHALHSA